MDQKVIQKGMYNRYSVAFKMKIVEEADNGLISMNAARKLYNIHGKNTITEWVGAVPKIKVSFETVNISHFKEQSPL